MAYDKPPTQDDLARAQARIAEHVTTTPVLRCAEIDEICNAKLFYKCENFQRTGSFKFRGACNAILSLRDTAAVATHSSGNHGAALARAAALRGIDAHIVVPEGAVASKIEAIVSYGGHIHICASTQQAREAELERVLRETGATAIPPYNDARIIAGQGTCALELLNQQPQLDLLLVPIGGGGLASGTCIAARARDIPVIGVEPAGADDTKRSLALGEVIADFTPSTVADGLRAKVGPLTLRILAKELTDIILVEDAEIVAAMRLVWRTMKIIIEPSSATVVAAVLKHKRRFTGMRLGLIFSGGNVDLDHLPWPTN